MNESRITKIEAAQRQIDAGIRMLFRNDDPVAVHTVAMAGFRILRDLVAKQKDLEDPIASLVKPGKEKAFWRGFNSFANFLKHADKDPDDISDGILEEANDVALLMATTYYGLLGFEKTEEMQALAMWCLAIHPEVFAQDASPVIQALVSASGGVRSLGRKEQLEIGSMLLEKWSALRAAAKGRIAQLDAGQVVTALGFRIFTWSTSVPKNWSNGCDIARVAESVPKSTSTSTKSSTVPVVQDGGPRPESEITRSRKSWHHVEPCLVDVSSSATSKIDPK